jgi:hypothetical protein
MTNLAMKDAIPHYEDHRSILSIAMWRQVAVDMKAEKTWIEFTSRHWENKRLSIVIEYLRRSAYARTKLANEMIRGEKVYNHTATISFMSRWMIVFAKNLSWEILNTQALACYRASTLGRSITYWIEYTNFKREHHHQQMTVKDHVSWSRWGFGILALEEHRNHMEYQKHSKEVAGKHYRKSKLFRGVSHWLLRLRNHKQKSSGIEKSHHKKLSDVLGGSVQNSQPGFKSRAFYAWCRDTQVSVKEKLKMNAVNATQEMKQLRAKVEVLEEAMRKRMR